MWSHVAAVAACRWEMSDLDSPEVGASRFPETSRRRGKHKKRVMEHYASLVESMRGALSQYFSNDIVRLQ